MCPMLKILTGLPNVHVVFWVVLTVVGVGVRTVVGVEVHSSIHRHIFYHILEFGITNTLDLSQTPHIIFKIVYSSNFSNFGGR